MPGETYKEGKIKNIDYMEKRKTEPEEEKENYLKSIMVYGKALFGENFDESDIEHIAKEESKRVPETFEPTILGRQLLFLRKHRNIS
ncbi:MAG: hypothetical protein ACLFPQ_05975 [Candidatus Woesearchaeota archaeon]